MSAIPAVVTLQALGGEGPDFSVFLMMGSIFLIFYLLVFRPQSRQRKELEEAIKTAQKGDVVVTAGGLHGKVYAAAEAVLTLEIGSVKGTAVRVDVDRSRIEKVIKAADAKAATKEKPEKANAKS